MKDVAAKLALLNLFMDKYGVIGWPIEHSLSPAMHNAAFKALNIDATYEKIPVKPELLEHFILNRKEVIGFNITVPYKVRVKEILDRSTELGPVQEEGSQYADWTGAVNTVRRQDNKLLYANTDVSGFLSSLKEDLKFEYYNKNVLLIGCGGAGRAVIAGLGWGEGSSRKIYIIDNNDNAIKSAKDFFLQFSYLEDKIEFISVSKTPEVIRDCQLLVNASPVGMKEGDTSPIDKKLLHKDLYVYDVVYNRKTQLVKDAKSLFGKEYAVGGLGMLLYQGVHAFEFWTGRNAPIEIMRDALNKALNLKLTA